MKSSLSSAKKQRLIFYISMAALPVLQFCIFYIYLNIRSFAMAFQTFDRGAGQLIFTGFNQFKDVFEAIGTKPELQASFGNSLELFLWTFVFGALLSVLFSFYIFKKFPGSGFFKIILYLPHIVSNIVFVVMYSFFLDNAVPAIADKLFGAEVMPLIGNWINDVGTTRVAVIVFTIWISFGTQVLMYTGAMSSISESVIESGKLDGITPIKELVFIVIPLIWSTFVTFMVVSVAGLFTNQMSLFAFFGTNAPPELYTFGYYLYKEVYQATTMESYPFLSAMGMLMTVVAVPATLLVKWALDKYGPKTE